MQRVEQSVILKAPTEEGLAEAYNEWFLALSLARESVPATAGQRIVIYDRLFSIMGNGKNRVLYYAIFYEHILLKETEVGPDRGQHMDKSGFSAVGPRRGNG